MIVTNRYIKAGSLYLLGNLFNTGIAFLTIPLFTRILTTNDYGVINTYTSWMGIVTIIIGMTFHMGIRAAFLDYENKIDDFLSAVTFLSILSFVATSVLVIIVIMLLKLDVPLILVILCLVQGFSSAIITNYSMYLMMKFRYKSRTMLLILPNLIITIVAVIAIMFISQSSKYLGKIIPSSLITLCFALLIIILIFLRSNVFVNVKYWKYALRISLPTILHGLSLTVLNQSDRIMLTALTGASETGIYSLIYNFSTIVSVVATSLEGIWIPWFTNNLKNRNIDQINKQVRLYIGIMTFVMICILLTSPEILVLLAPKVYWVGKMIIPPIVLSSFVVFLYIIYVNVEHFHKKTRYIALNTIIAASSNIILNMIFIPMYGMYAAAVTTLVSYLLSLFLHYKYARSIEKTLFPIDIVIIPTLLIIASTILFYLLLSYPMIRWTIFAIATIIAAFRWRSQIRLFIGLN